MPRPVLIVPLVLIVFCTPSSNDTRAQQVANEVPEDHAASSTRAKEIYRRDCLVCHGANGDGKTAILRDRYLNLPDWTDPNSLGARADQQLFNSSRFGKGKMPAESVGRADDTEVRSLIRYIRTMTRNEAVVNATDGTKSPK